MLDLRRNMCKQAEVLCLGPFPQPDTIHVVKIHFDGIDNVFLVQESQSKVQSCITNSSIECLSCGSLDQHKQRRPHIVLSSPRPTACPSCGQSGIPSSFSFFLITCIFFLISAYGTRCVNNWAKFRTQYQTRNKVELTSKTVMPKL